MRRALSPWEPTQTPTEDRKAKVLIRTGASHRVEDISGPTRTLQELTKQLTIIAVALTTARAKPEQPPAMFQPQTKPTTVKERLY